MEILEYQALQEAVAKLPKWELKEDGLCRKITFANFKQALDFVNKVGEIAEAAGHHPDIDIRYNRVLLCLFSHDAGGITPRDIEMAARLDQDLMG